MSEFVMRSYKDLTIDEADAFKWLHDKRKRGGTNMYALVGRLAFINLMERNEAERIVKEWMEWGHKLTEEQLEYPFIQYRKKFRGGLQ
jgi:hypothetical protein